jgi:hypothetical protein
MQVGMSRTAAERLAKKVQGAETKLSPDQLKKLSMFEGVMKIDQGQHGTQDSHASHPKH